MRGDFYGFDKINEAPEESGIKVIEIKTDLSSYAASDLRKVLEGLLAEKVEKVVVNLSQVNHINSTAVGASGRCCKTASSEWWRP